MWYVLMMRQAQGSSEIHASIYWYKYKYLNLSGGDSDDPK